MQKIETASTGDFLSRFHLSATAALFPAIAAVITAFAICEKYYTEMMNEANALTVTSSKAAASAAKKSLEYQATSMKWEAIMGMTSAGISLGMIGVNAGVDGYYANKTSAIETEMNNSKTFLKAYDERLETGPRSTNVSDLPQEVELETFARDNTEEVSALLKSHQLTPEKTLHEPITTDQSTAISQSKETGEIQKSREAIKNTIDKKQEEIREMMQDKVRRLDYVRLVDTMIQQAPNAVAKSISESQLKKQGAKESEKILSTSTESLADAFEKQNAGQFSQTAQEMDQLIQQLDKTTQADRYR